MWYFYKFWILFGYVWIVFGQVLGICVRVQTNRNPNAGHGRLLSMEMAISCGNGVVLQVPWGNWRFLMVVVYCDCMKTLQKNTRYFNLMSAAIAFRVSIPFLAQFVSRHRNADQQQELPRQHGRNACPHRCSSLVVTELKTGRTFHLLWQLEKNHPEASGNMEALRTCLDLKADPNSEDAPRLAQGCPIRRGQLKLQFSER